MLELVVIAIAIVAASVVAHAIALRSCHRDGPADRGEDGRGVAAGRGG
jgi:hypothetical protein